MRYTTRATSGSEERLADLRRADAFLRVGNCPDDYKPTSSPQNAPVIRRDLIAQNNRFVNTDWAQSSAFPMLACLRLVSTIECISRFGTNAYYSGRVFTPTCFPPVYLRTIQVDDQQITAALFDVEIHLIAHDVEMGIAKRNRVKVEERLGCSA